VDGSKQNNVTASAFTIDNIDRVFTLIRHTNQIRWLDLENVGLAVEI